MPRRYNFLRGHSDSAKTLKKKLAVACRQISDTERQEVY